MNITPDQIDTIEDGGILDGQEVKMVRLKGGFWMAIFKGKVISGGSHPAIVKHTVSKMHPNFQPVMCKSETYSDAFVDRHSHFLNEELRKTGHDIYSIQNNNEIEFQITKHNLKIASVKTYLNDNNLFIPDINIPKEFTHALASAATEKALELKTKAIKVK